jgi:lysyl-tRNA synthetase class II
MKIKDVMTSEIACVDTKSTAADAAAKMKNQNTGTVIVVDGSSVKGIVTDRQITIKAVAEQKDPRNTPVSDIMTKDIVGCSENDDIFDALVVPKLTEPTFVLDYPSEYSPLAKPGAANPEIAERFELYINGMEIANAYSELNDPLLQEKNFRGQMEAKRKGDEEAQPYDADFITALQHGLPPTGGLGIGIDRLVMILTGRTSLREVILFPQLRTRD